MTKLDGARVAGVIIGLALAIFLLTPAFLYGFVWLLNYVFDKQIYFSYFQYVGLGLILIIVEKFIKSIFKGK